MKRVTRKKSAQPRRSAPSRRAGARMDPTDLQEQCSESTIELLLSRGMEFLLARGCRKAVLVRQLKQAARALTTRARTGARRVSTRSAYMNHAGRVLYDWSADHNYTDADGKPLALKIGGPPPS